MYTKKPTTGARSQERFFGKGMYNQRENPSLESVQWLESMNGDDKSRFYGRIQHAYNYKEKKIGDFSIDGYAEINEKKFLFEYRGCAFHGCPFCNIKPRVKIPGQKTYERIRIFYNSISIDSWLYLSKF